MYRLIELNNMSAISQEPTGTYHVEFSKLNPVTLELLTQFIQKINAEKVGIRFNRSTAP